MSEDQSAYASAGVDIDQAQRALESVREAVRGTHGDEVVGGIGAFGAMFAPRLEDYQKPVLVSSVDGVGTKTKVAAMVGDWSGIGRDIVNHCVNDILCQGARPLFFLDYFGCSNLEPDVFEAVVTGAAKACKHVGCALIGGETAEMPGVYHQGEADVVGCIVGIVDAADTLPRPTVAEGDVLIGIASDGLHTNGFSLARKALFDQGGIDPNAQLPGSNQTYAQALLAPHRCYFRPLQPLLKDEPLKALAHVTGGGLCDNLPRVLPSGLSAHIDPAAWQVPPIFAEIQRCGKIRDDDMRRAFNMGIGMIAVVDAASSDDVVGHLQANGERAFAIGTLVNGDKSVVFA
ncbi:MAG TPA: phosphoribosylformylglycinamidine cyclo-ligase [Fimbriimonadaceae bacterium]|nr:phosphoribosylformylglycinamidine cyclo-ligase [Fimbriimonadaceae bacterium]